MGEHPALSDAEIADIARQRLLADPPPVHVLINVEQLSSG